MKLILKCGCHAITKLHVKGQRLKVCEAKCTPQDWLVLIVCLFDGGSACTMPWLHHSQDCQMCQTQPGEKLLVLSGFQDQNIAGNLKEVCQTVPKKTILLQKDRIHGTIWPTSIKFPANFWTRKPDSTDNLFVRLRLASFCLPVCALV